MSRASVFEVFPNVVDARARVFATFQARVAPNAPRSLLRNIHELCAGVDRLIDYAPSYDLNDKTHANGYWTYAKVAIKFVQRVNEHAARNNGKLVDQSFDDVASYLVTQLKFIDRIHRLSQTHLNNKKSYEQQLREHDKHFQRKADETDETCDCEQSSKSSGTGEQVNCDSDDDLNSGSDLKPNRSDSGIEDDNDADDTNNCCDESGLFVSDNELVTAILQLQKEPQTMQQLSSLYANHNR